MSWPTTSTPLSKRDMSTILMIVDRTFPTEHAFLEEVYNGILPQWNYQPVWLFRNDKKVMRWYKTRWNGKPVYLVPNNALYGFALRPVLGALLFVILMYIVKKERVQIIQVRNWLLGCFFAALLKKIWRVTFVFQRSFPIYESALLRKDGRNPSLKDKIVFRLKKKLMRLFIDMTDVTFPISDEMRRTMIEEGYDSCKLVTVPLGYSRSVPSEDNVKALRDRLDLGHCKIVVYVGTLMFWRDPKFMVRVHQRVLGAIPSAVLLIVGGTTDEIAELSLFAETIGVFSQVRFAGYVPRNQVPDYISLADVCISPIPEIPLYNVSSPTKLFEYLGVGKPVVASRIVEQENVLRLSGGGLCTEFNESAFSEAIVKLLTSPLEANLMGTRGMEYVNRHHSYEKIASIINHTYQSIMSAG